MKKFVSVLLAVLLFTLSVGFAAEEEKVLNIYTWEDYISPDVMAAFKAETGISINIIPFVDNNDMFTKLRMDSGASYDLILASDVVLGLARKEGLLMPLDMAKLPNFENLNPEYVGQFFDPDAEYTVPYAAGSPVIVYDPARVEGEITGFADLWDEQFEDSLCLIDDARVMLGQTLKMLGYPFNSTDKAQVEEAAQKMADLQENIRVLDYAAPYQHILSGEVSAAYMFTSQAVVCQQNNPDLKVVFPEEGIGFGIDAFVVPKNAAHPENAHLFLDFLLRPEVAAETAAWTMYLNPNLAAEELIDPAVMAYDALNIPEDLLATKDFAQDLPAEAESMYQDLWLRAKLA